MVSNDQHEHPDDERLATELAAFWRSHDPVPELVIEGARAAFEFRDVDAQIAGLLADSALEDKELAGVRGVGSRLLTFALGERYLEVDVQAAEGQRRELAGYLVPAGPGAIEVVTPSGVVTERVDGAGRFRVRSAPAGPTRFVIRLAGHQPFTTSWIAL